jgi:hypothetical protein
MAAPCQGHHAGSHSARKTRAGIHGPHRPAHDLEGANRSLIAEANAGDLPAANEDNSEREYPVGPELERQPSRPPKQVCRKLEADRAAAERRRRRRVNAKAPRRTGPKLLFRYQPAKDTKAKRRRLLARWRTNAPVVIRPGMKPRTYVCPRMVCPPAKRVRIAKP